MASQYDELLEKKNRTRAEDKELNQLGKAGFRLQAVLGELTDLSANQLVDYAKRELDLELPKENGRTWLHCKIGYTIYERHERCMGRELLEVPRKRLKALDKPETLAQMREEDKEEAEMKETKKGKAAKKAGNKKPVKRGLGVGAYVLGLFEKHGPEHSNNEAIAEKCVEKFGSATKATSIAWYRNKYRKDNPTKAKKAKATKVAQAKKTTKGKGGSKKVKAKARKNA